MLLSKKIEKLRKDTVLQKKEDHLKIHKKTSKYRYREIPLHPKVIPPYIIHQIHGDIPLAEYKGQVVMDVSMYNELKSYHDITVNEMFEQKIIAIKPSIKKDRTPAQWNQLVDQLIKSEEAYIQEWAQTIKGFCHTFSKVMQRQSRKRMKSGLRRKFFAQVTEESESQERTLFMTFPCVQFRFRLRNHNMEMKELLFSESFVGELGYSVDSFVTTVFQEGLPQLMPYDNPMAEYIIKPLIENYFSFGEEGYRTAEFDSVLLINQGFARDVRIRALFLMNYETSTFGMDVIMAVISRSEPYLLKEKIYDPINEDFLQTMAQKEQEVDYFLSAFYDLSLQKRYTNYHNICNIKEIFQEDDENSDIIVKKFEEESYQ